MGKGFTAQLEITQNVLVAKLSPTPLQFHSTIYGLTCMTSKYPEHGPFLAVYSRVRFEVVTSCVPTYVSEDTYLFVHTLAPKDTLLSPELSRICNLENHRLIPDCSFLCTYSQFRKHLIPIHSWWKTFMQDRLRGTGWSQTLSSIPKTISYKVARMSLLLVGAKLSAFNAAIRRG